MPWSSLLVELIKRRLLPFIVVGLAGVFLFYEFVLQVSPGVMTNDFMAAFHINALVLGTTMAMYYYSYAPMQIFGGLSYDRFGARKTLTFAILICAIGSACIAMSNGIILAGAGRFLTGFGSAFSFVGMLFLGRRWFAPRYFFLVAGITELVGCLGAIGGESPIAATVAWLGWRTTLGWLALIGVVLSVLVWLVIRDFPADHPQRDDFLQGQQHSIRQSFSYIFKHSQLWATGVYAFLVFAPITAFAALWGVPFLKASYHLSTGVASAAVSMIWLGMGIGSPLAGWISERMRSRIVPLAVSAVLGVVVTLAILYKPGLSINTLFTLLFLFGVATFGQALSFLVVGDITPNKVIGTAMGFNNLLIVLSGAIFQPLVGALLDAQWNGTMLNHSPVYTAHDYRVALAVIPVCYLLGTIVSLFWMRETRCEHSVDEERAQAVLA